MYGSIYPLVVDLVCLNKASCECDYGDPVIETGGKSMKMVPQAIKWARYRDWVLKNQAFVHEQSTDTMG